MYLRMPWSPRHIFSTSLGKPNIKNKTSTLSAICLGSCQVAPSSSKDLAFYGVRLNTVSLYLALRRCLHMLNPMTPVPIHPILSASIKRYRYNISRKTDGSIKMTWILNIRLLIIDCVLWLDLIPLLTLVKGFNIGRQPNQCSVRNVNCLMYK